MKRINLTKGKYAIVDDEDFARVSTLKWYARSSSHNNWYAVRDEWVNSKREWLTMQRFILRQPKGTNIDHINHVKFDNRKSNLRICTHRQNCQNRKCGYGSSLYKGVSWHKGKLYKGHRQKGYWVGHIRHYGRDIYLGRFENEIEAARAYDIKAIELFDEYAYLNFS